MPKDWAREAEAVVREVLDGSAADVDRTGSIPESHFEALAERGLYGFVLSEGMSPDILIDTAATIIGGCLATGFVWAQHLGALRTVAFADNAELRTEYLPLLRDGRYRCGVSYAGAQREPTLFAESAGDGYVVRGTAPFVTGWPYLDAVATSVRDSSTDSVVTLLIPVKETSGITAEPLSLIAADASATVKLSFEDSPVAAARVIGRKSVTEFDAGRGALTDWINGALALGVLSRCVRQLEQQDLESASYRERYTALRTRFTTAIGNPEATYALRAEVAEAAVIAAAAGVVAAGSRATATGSTPERLMREATFALVCTTRDPIRAALLDRLAP